MLGRFLSKFNNSGGRISTIFVFTKMDHLEKAAKLFLKLKFQLVSEYLLKCQNTD